MTSILRRKLADPDGAPSRGVTALRALRLALARVAGDMLSLAVAPIAARHTPRLPDDLAQDIAGDGLLMRLDGPDGQAGAAVLSLPLVSALIQCQTLGRVADRAPDPRAFTDTDAMIAAPFIEGCLTMAADLAEVPEDRACLTGLRFDSRAPDARTLALGLRAPRYRAFAFTLDLAEGRRQGDLTFLLPVRGAPEADTPPPPRDPATSPFMDVETDLLAVLARLRMTLDQVQRLAPGDLLPIPRERIDETALVAIDGTQVARGRLGQMNGYRALRLMAPTPVPRVAPTAPAMPPLREGQAGQFLPLTRPDPPPHTPEAAPPPLDLAGLAQLSPQEAAQRIGALAGLSDEDIRRLGPDPGPDDIDGGPV